MLANRSRRPRPAAHRPAPALAATVLTVLLAQLPAAAANSPVEDLEADLCPSGASASGPVQLTGAVTGAAETLTVGCDATLDLDGHTLTVGNVIITPGTALTITDTSAGEDGVLTANAPEFQAGIRTTGATLIIEGGTVNATGGRLGSGIGGPNSAVPAHASGGTVIINGGTVVAQGGNSGAGIGGGNNGTDGGAVTISGGTVTATGGTYGGAGIGGGDGGSNLDRGIGAQVTITGGTITANGGESAAGIGGGATGGDGGTLSVTDGTVTATGGSSGGAGIGGGASNGDGAGASVTITGGAVTATGGAPGPTYGGGAGIGGGGAFTFNTFIFPAGGGGTVLIEGGVVAATAGSADAATIGAGGNLGDPVLSGAPGTLTLGTLAVRVDDGLTTTITFEPPAGRTSAGVAPSTPVRIGGELPSLPAGDAVWSRADGTVTPLAATSADPRTVTYGSAPASVAITGALGTASTRGVVADSDGELVAEVCLALPVGSVIEVWVLSSPRLVAAHLVTDAPCQRFAVPFGAPLDGGGPLVMGPSTLQLALTTASGREAVNIGITVGGPVPTTIPAGEGTAPESWSFLLLLAMLVTAARRALTLGGRHR